MITGIWRLFDCSAVFSFRTVKTSHDSICRRVVAERAKTAEGRKFEKFPAFLFLRLYYSMRRCSVKFKGENKCGTPCQYEQRIKEQLMPMKKFYALKEEQMFADRTFTSRYKEDIITVPGIISKPGSGKGCSYEKVFVRVKGGNGPVTPPLIMLWESGKAEWE